MTNENNIQQQENEGREENGIIMKIQINTNTCQMKIIKEYTIWRLRVRLCKKKSGGPETPR